MAENPYKKLADSMAMREQGYRSSAENVAAMTGPLSSIGTQTGAPSNIDSNEIASIAGLANIKAVSQNQSTEREKLGNRTARRMPKYVKAYKNYLQWRYPTTYGAGRSSSSGGVLGSYTVPGLPEITPPPGLGE